MLLKLLHAVTIIAALWAGYKVFWNRKGAEA